MWENLFLYLFVGVLVIQAFYYLGVYSIILRFKSKHNSSVDQMSVSVIVCAHNEMENLKKLVPVLLNQKYSNFELIIVDDRSTDGVYEYLIQTFGANHKFKTIRVEKTPQNISPKKYALSEGIKAARHELILLTDADCLPVSDLWISGMAGVLRENKDIVLGYSPYEHRKGFLNRLIQYDTIHTAMQYFSFAMHGNPYMGVGRNVLYRKSLFLKNNGLDAHNHVLGGDDDLFINAVATKQNVVCNFDKNTCVYSVPKKLYIQWFKQKRRHLSVGIRYKLKHKFMLGIAAVSHLLFYLLFFIGLCVNLPLSISFLILRSLVFLLIFVLIAKKLEGKYEGWGLLLWVDFVYIINYLTITLSLGVFKKIKWI